MVVSSTNRTNNEFKSYGADATVKASTSTRNERVNQESESVIYEPGSSVEDFGLYTAKGVAASSLKSNYKIQEALHSLGFYSGPTDGNLKSKISLNAINTFQKVYGLNTSGQMNGATKTKLEKAYDMKQRIVNSNVAQKIDDAMSIYKLDYTQRDTFANTWVFLRISMGLSAKQAAGVCGNIMNESVFSADNAQDKVEVNGVTKYYPGVHNKKDYSYQVGDGVGYGLIQWTFASRKKGLQNMAKNMGLSVSNLNVQLAFFRDEMLNDGYYKSKWEKVQAAKTVKDTSDAFLEYIENPEIPNYKERTKYSRIIYNNMKTILGV